jgi:transglutaminase superfamily protein
VTGALLVLAAGLFGWAAQSEFILITGERNGEFSTTPPTLREDDFHNPRLELLRAREKLDELISGAPRQFDKIVVLRRWVRKQWDYGGSFYYPPWDAVEILDLARYHGNKGFCAQYAVVFLQACQALGIHARYVDLAGHFVVSVWSDDYDRWVVMDPTNDLHYERDGIPVGGRSLYRAYWTNDLRGLVQVDGTGNRKALTREDLDSFRLYAVDIAADQLSKPLQVEVNGSPRTLVHARDYRKYPRVGSDKVVITSELRAFRMEGVESWVPERPQISSQDLRSAFNQTMIFLANERVSGGSVRVVLFSSNSPTFKQFLVRSDESDDWLITPAPTFRWRLHPGMNRLSARVETAFGWQGQVSEISLFYKPRLIPSVPSFPCHIVKLIWHRSTD